MTADTQQRGEMMTNYFSKMTAKTGLRLAAAAGLGLGLSGCVYDAGLGLGYASDGYSSGYDCDPYSPFDNYYNCDYGYGFSNIGYGGGWYNNFYYPGHGFYLFDRGGRRYNMQRDHHRYWGQQRYEWNRGRGNRGGQHSGHGYTDNGGGHLGAIGWPERGGGRVRDERRRPDGYERNGGQNGYGQGGYGQDGRRRGENHRGGQGHGNGQGDGRGVYNGNNGQPSVNPDYGRTRNEIPGSEQPAVTQPRERRGTYGGDRGGWGNSQGGQGEQGYRPSVQPAPQQGPQQRAEPQPRQERPASLPRPENRGKFGGALRQPSEVEE